MKAVVRKGDENLVGPNLPLHAGRGPTATRKLFAKEETLLAQSHISCHLGAS